MLQLAKRAVSQQRMKTFPVISIAERERRLDPDDPACPFYGYEGNRSQVELAMDIAADAFDDIIDAGIGSGYGTRVIAQCARTIDARILLQGSKGAGKTDFAWRFSKIPETPLCELDASDLKKPEQIIEGLRQTLSEFGSPLVAERAVGTMSYYTAPPMGLFIDEIQQLSKHMQDALLKLTAQNDRTLRTSTATINCRKVYIIGATTHPGDLREALVSRFTVITLERHCLNEIAKIVNGKYPDWELSDCLRIAKMQPVSRNALDFAEHVVRACRRHSCDIPEGIELVGKRLGLDESGLNSQAINSLVVLAQAGDAGLSKKAICVSIGIEEEQFTNSVLPLLLPTELHTAFVRITNKHYITDAGLEELRKRGYDV